MEIEEIVFLTNIDLLANFKLLAFQKVLTVSLEAWSL